MYSIGELANLTSVNIQTIRFYEHKELLFPIARKDSSRHRLYDQDCLKQLKFIVQARDLGFGLDEIKELLELRIESEQHRDIIRQKTKEKLKEVQRKAKHLKQLQKTLKSLIEDCETRPVGEKCPIIEYIEK